MALKAVAKGLGTYLRHVVMAALFPLAWLGAWRIAGRHADRDPRGRAKVAVGIVAGVLLAAGAFVAVQDFRAGALDGMYDSLDGRLVRAVGESEYQDNVGIAGSKTFAIAALTPLLEEARAAGDANRTAVLEASLATAQADLAKAQAKIALLTPNHGLYGQIHAEILQKDDAAIRTLVAGAPFDYTDMDKRTDRAFGIKDKAVSDMSQTYLLLVYPGLIGLFYAPLVFALGNVLRRAWEPSDSVGFKPYPAGGMGFFLLLGAFGVPALFFAAWTFMDMEGRSREGQIAL